MILLIIDACVNVLPLILVGLSILFGWLRGRKREWQYSLAKLISTIISVVLAIISARLIAVPIARLLAKLIAENADLIEGFGEVIKDIPSVLAVTEASISLIIALLLYPLLFFLIKLILGGILKALVKITLRKRRRQAIKTKRMERREAAQRYALSYLVSPFANDEQGKMAVTFTTADIKLEDATDEAGTEARENASDGVEVENEATENCETTDTVIPQDQEEGVVERTKNKAHEDDERALRKDALRYYAFIEKTSYKIHKESERMRKRKENPSLSHPLLSAFLSILANLLVFIAYLAPITAAFGLAIGSFNGILDIGFTMIEGYSDYGKDMLTELREELEEMSFDDFFDEPDIYLGYRSLKAILAPEDNFLINTVNACGGHLIFDKLTTAKAGNITLNLSDEVDLIVSTCKIVLSVPALKELDEPNLSRLTVLVKDFKATLKNESVLITVLSDYLSGMGKAALNGDSFLNVDFSEEKPTDEEMYMVEIMAGITSETIKQDLTTIANTSLIILENDGFNAENGYDVISVLLEETTQSEIVAEIVKNDHIISLFVKITDYVVHLICVDDFGMPGNDQLLYEFFLENIAEDVKTSNPVENILDSFDLVGIKITAESALELAARFSEMEEVTLEDVKRVFMDVTLVLVLDDESEKKIILSEDVFIEHTPIITPDKLNIGDVTTDKEQDVETIVDMIPLIAKIIELSGKENDVDATLEIYGEMLDNISDLTFVGRENVEKMISIIMQSLGITDFNINPYDALKISEYLNETAREHGYVSAGRDIGRIVETVSDITKDEEIDTNAIKEVLGDLTPVGADAVKTLVTPEFMESCGVAQKSAEAVSDIVYNIFDGLADAKNAGMSDEEYKSETEGVADAVDIFAGLIKDVNKTTDEDDNKIFGEDKESGIKSATEYVDKLTETQTVANAIVNAVYKDGEKPTVDPANSGFKFNEEEKLEFIDALQAKLDAASQDDKADTEKVVVAIAAIMNTAVEIVDGQLVLINADVE